MAVSTAKHPTPCHRESRHSLAPGLLFLFLATTTTLVHGAGSRVEVPRVESTTPAPAIEGAPLAESAEAESASERLVLISCRDPENHPASWLDQTHSYLNQRLCAPAAWFDGFFGDDRALEETPVGTFFRLRNELLWDQDRNLRARARISANISLPGASEKLRLLFTRDEDLDGEFSPYEADTERGKETRIGLRYNLSDRLRSRLDMDATVKVNLGSLNPIVRGRYRQVEQLTDETFLRFTQIAFWEADEGVGTTSRADWEWYQNFDTQIRLTGQGTLSESSDGVDWRTGLTRFHQLDRKTAVRAEIGAFGWTDPNFETEEYFVDFRYRRSFARPWLFYELQPEHAWVIDDRSGNRRGDWRFTATLEIQFENAPARTEREERRTRRFRQWRERQAGKAGPREVTTPPQP